MKTYWKFTKMFYGIGGTKQERKFIRRVYWIGVITAHISVIYSRWLKKALVEAQMQELMAKHDRTPHTCGEDILVCKACDLFDEVHNLAANN